MRVNLSDRHPIPFGHERDACVGEYCAIHKPSPHHMNDWPLEWNNGKKVLYRVCVHDVEHPDPDDATYRAGYSKAKTKGNDHPCDGCCGMSDLAEWHRLTMVTEAEAKQLAAELYLKPDEWRYDSKTASFLVKDQRKR